MDITVENLERAVAQFYNSADSTAQAQAHQWLTSVQSSPSAWGFVWELLQPARAREVQFFAATTLHTKIMKNWSQIPPDQYNDLKNRLLETILAYVSGQELILNRLCIALSALLIQMTPRYWDDSISDLLNLLHPENFPTVPPQRVVWILLEVLTFIPEEFQTMTLTSSHKSFVRNELEKHAEKVMTIIERSLGIEGVGDVAFKAAAAWLQLGVSLPVCINLSGSLINVIRSKFADITESCEHEMEALNQMMTHPESHKYPSYVLQLLPPILQLTSDIKAAGNDEALTNAYKILIGIGDMHTKILLNALKNPETSPSVQGLISHLLDCTASPGDYPKDETRSQLCFSFWYLLQDEMITLDKDDLEFVSGYLVPVYEKLCEILLHKSKLPDDIDRLSAQDQEAIRIYRQDIADTIVYCYYVAKDYLLNLLVRCQREARCWQEAEAVLQVVLALSETATAQDDETVIGLLVNTPSQFLTNHKVINTLNQTIGAYAEWLGDWLEKVIPGLLASLQSPETATSATMALKDITRERSSSLEPFAPALLVACQEALGKGHLKPNECVRLMYSVGRLHSVLPYTQMLGSLEPLLTNYCSEIEQLRTQPQNPQVKGILVLRLKMLSTLCSSLYSLEVGPDPPAFVVLSRILPILSGIYQTYSSDPVVIEEVCNFLHACVVNALPGKPSQSWVLDPIINLGAACYTAQPNKQALEMVKQVCILYGKRENEGAIRHLLLGISQETIRLQQSLAPDVLQTYLQLLTTIVKKIPTLIISTLDMQHALNFATECMLMAEQPTVKSSVSFITTVVNASNEELAFVNPLRMVGHHITATVINCIAGQTPRSNLDIFSDLVLALNKRFPENFRDWLLGGLSLIINPDDNQKELFCKAVLREKSNKRKVIEIIKEFALVSRGLVTTEFDG